MALRLGDGSGAARAVELVVGLVQAALMLACFVGILWTLSGPLHVSLGTGAFDIPGYMVFAAILYAGSAPASPT